jgi:hypothetical protein
MKLSIRPDRIEYTIDELDSNAISFPLGENGYFSIQTCIYLEEDELLNEPFLELNEQSQSEAGGIAEILFSLDAVEIFFKTGEEFIDKYSSIEIKLKEAVDMKMVDFFANYLFLGDGLRYAAAFPAEKKVRQTTFRTSL